MKRNDIINNLNDLIQLDIDAWFAYKQAMEGIAETQIRDELQNFQGDHERHVQVLSEKVRQMGGTPPKFLRDFKGFLIEGMTAIRRLAGTTGALNAMELNERVTNSTYEKHALKDYPDDLRQTVGDFFCDERRHIEYIRQMLHLLKAEHPAEKVYHVVSHEPEGWWVEVEEQQEPVAKTATKDDAVKRASDLAHLLTGAEVFVHRQDGTVEAQYSFRDEQKR